MTLKEAMNNEEINRKVEEAKDAEEAARILVEYGVTVTGEELLALLPAEDGELTDENLEDVAGGLGFNYNILSIPRGPFKIDLQTQARLIKSASSRIALMKLCKQFPLLKKLFGL